MHYIKLSTQQLLFGRLPCLPFERKITRIGHRNSCSPSCLCPTPENFSNLIHGSGDVLIVDIPYLRAPQSYLSNILSIAHVGHHDDFCELRNRASSFIPNAWERGPFRITAISKNQYSHLTAPIAKIADEI